MKRGPLNTKAMPVARMRVGNCSGSHTAIHEYCPSVKKPLTAGDQQQQIAGCASTDRARA